jgi:hypothetical protein
MIYIILLVQYDWTRDEIVRAASTSVLGARIAAVKAAQQFDDELPVASTLAESEAFDDAETTHIYIQEIEDSK